MATGTYSLNKDSNPDIFITTLGTFIIREIRTEEINPQSIIVSIKNPDSSEKDIEVDIDTLVAIYRQWLCNMKCS